MQLAMNTKKKRFMGMVIGDDGNDKSTNNRMQSYL